MEGKGHRFTADLVQVGRSPVTAKERAEWLRLDALARSRKYGPVAESADDLDALAALIAEAELAEAVGPVVPGRWITLKDGRHVYIKDKGAGTGPMGPGTAQSTLGAEPAPTPAKPKPGPVDETGRPSAVRKRLDEFADTHAEDRVETLLVVAPDGSTVFEATGDEHSVQYTPEDAIKFAGCTAIHNHPTNNSFSDADLKTTITWGIVEHVVVSPKYVFTLKGAEPRETDLVDSDTLLSRTLGEFQSATDGLYAKYLPLVRMGEINEREASNEHTHEAMQIVDSRFPRLQYARRIRGRGRGI